MHLEEHQVYELVQVDAREEVMRRHPFSVKAKYKTKHIKHMRAQGNDSKK